MKNNSSGEVVRIGRFCSDATGCENLMQPIKDAFNSTCIAFLESLADTTAPWITVDEIGYLENTSYDYQKAFERLMNKKRIIMVVRKQDLSFLNWPAIKMCSLLTLTDHLAIPDVSSWLQGRENALAAINSWLNITDSRS